MTDAAQNTSERRGFIRWIFAHPKTFVAIVLLLLVAIALLITSEVAENRLTRRIAAIKAKGEPTSVADLLARQRHIPDEENMLVALVKPAEKMATADIPPEKDAQIKFVGRAKRTPTGQRWSDDELAAAHWYLQQFAAEIASIHEALKLKDSVDNVQWKTPAMDSLMPELADLRHVSKVLELEILTAANDGDQAKTERLLLEAPSILNALQGDLAIIGALVQLAMNALTFDGVERSINQAGVSDSALQRIDSLLLRIEQLPDMSSAARGERATFLDTQKWLYSTNWARYVPALSSNDMAEAVELQTMLVDVVNAPYGTLNVRVAAIEARSHSLPQYYTMSRTGVSIIIPAYSRAIVLYRRGIGVNRALRAAVAAERFRLSKGRWPERLDQLVPIYLGAVPSDPIDEKPIRYAIIPEGIKTWTIAGDDHDEDNGGDVRRLEQYNEKIKPKDCGWVILNPELRGRPAASQPTTSGKAGR